MNNYAIAVRRALTCMVLALMGLASMPAHATKEKEPNNSCSLPQSAGTLTDSTLTGTVPSYDADYFLIKATAGTELEWTATGQDNGSGYGPLGAPLIAVYDSSCQLLVSSSAYYDEPMVKLHFAVPSNGKYIFEITSCCDLSGGYGQGDYLATVAAYQPPPIIYGYVKEANGNPVSGASVTLFHCPSAAYELCDDQSVTSASVAQGSYSIGVQLVPGDSYQLSVSSYYASGFARSPVFVAPASDLRVDLRFAVSPVAITSASWTSSSVPDGGTAGLTATMVNQTGASQKIDVWLWVQMDQTGAEYSSTRYQQGQTGSAKPVTLTLNPGETRTVSLSFAAPKNALSGTGGYVSFYVGKYAEPFNTYAVYDNLSYVITPAGSASLASGAVVEAERQQQQERMMRGRVQGPRPLATPR